MNNKKTESQDKLEGHLRKIIQQHGPTFWQALLEITSFYQHFGFCECGRMPVTLNVEKVHFMYCKKCKAYWGVGWNLFGAWRHEDESVWKKNEELLSKARPIEERRLYLSPGLHHTMLMTFKEMRQAAESDYSTWGKRQEKAERETPSSNQEHCFDNELPF